MSKSNSPEGFTSLGQRISLHRAATPPPPSARPTLIVICTWMNAAEKHIAIYAEQYIQLFPNADILLIRSSAKDVFSSPAKHSKRLIPALELVESMTNPSVKTQPRLLLHTFSNGGGINGLHLALNLRARGKAKAGTAFAKLILDCNPSKPDMEEGTRALTLGVPTAFGQRFLVGILARVFFVLFRLVQIVFKRDNELLSLRKQLNEEPKLFPGPRMYLYSENDKMVGWKYVNSHAQEAKRKGFDVKEVQFKNAAHCALALEDHKKYWGAVTDFFGSDE